MTRLIFFAIKVYIMLFISSYVSLMTIGYMKSNIVDSEKIAYVSFDIANLFMAMFSIHIMIKCKSDLKNRKFFYWFVTGFSIMLILLNAFLLYCRVVYT